MNSSSVFARSWTPYGKGSVTNTTECSLTIVSTCSNTIWDWISILKNNIYYRNDLRNPYGGNRTVVIGVYDSGTSLYRGNQYSSIAFNLVFNLINDGPVITLGNEGRTIDLKGNYYTTGIGISGVCDETTVSTNSSLRPLSTYVEKGLPVSIAPHIQITDTELAIQEILVQITAGCVRGDKLELNTTLIPTISQQFINQNGSSVYRNETDTQYPCSIRLQGIDNGYNYSLYVQNIMYSNDQDWLPSHQRQITITVMDILTNAINGNLNISATYNLSVIPYDDDPVIQLMNGTTIVYTEQIPVISLPFSNSLNFSIIDKDSYYIAKATVTILSECDKDDVLNYTYPTNNYYSGIQSPATYTGYSGPWNDKYAPCTLVLEGIETLSVYRDTLQNITFTNTNPYPSNRTRNIQISLVQYTPYLPGVTQSNGNQSTTATVSFTVQFIDQNNEPVIKGINNLYYTEQDTPIEISSGIILSDPENDYIQQVTVQIITGCAVGDTLSHHVTNIGSTNVQVRNFVPHNTIGNTTTMGGNVLVSNDGSTLPCSLTFVGIATIAVYNEILAHITYNNPLDNPSASNRIVQFAVTDVSAPKTGTIVNLTTYKNSTIFFTDVNDAPIIRIPYSLCVEFTENIPLTIDNTLTITDPEYDNLSGVTVTVTQGCSYGDVLTFGTYDSTAKRFYPYSITTLGLISSYANYGTVSVPCRLTLTGTNIPAENYTLALQFLVYNNTIDNINNDIRILTYNVTDNPVTGNKQPLSTYSSVNVTIYQVNDPPILLCGGSSNGTSTVPYNQNSVPVFIVPNLYLSDWENDYINEAVITIASGCDSGDILTLNHTLAVGSGIVIGTYIDPLTLEGCSSCSLTLLGKATASTYETLLRSLTYHSTSRNPSSSLRKISIQVKDIAGTGTNGNTTSECISTVLLNVYNDPPILTPSIPEGTVAIAYVEKSGWHVLDCAIEISDPESDPMGQVMVQITDGCSPGDQLWYIDRNASLSNMNTWPSPFYAGSYDLLSGSNYVLNITTPSNLSTTMASQDNSCVLILTGVRSIDDYTLALRRIAYRNVLDNAANVNRTVTVTLMDAPLTGVNGNQSSSSTVLISYRAINDPPVVSGGPLSTTFTEDAVSTLLDPSALLSIYDIDDAQFTSAIVSLTQGYTCSEDTLDITGSGSTILSINNIQMVWNCPILTFNGTATITTYRSLLSTVLYRNNNTYNPSLIARGYAYSVTDAGSIGTEGYLSSSSSLASIASSLLLLPSGLAVPTMSMQQSRNATGIITIVATNDQPYILYSNDIVTYIENTTPIVLDRSPYMMIHDNDMMTDRSTADISLVMAQITTGYISSEDILSIDMTRCASGLVYSWDNTTGLLRIWRYDPFVTVNNPTTGLSSVLVPDLSTLANMSLAEASAALASITYQNTNTNMPATNNRTVTLTVTDDGKIGTPGPLTSVGVSTIVMIYPKNNAPSVYTSDKIVSFREDSNPIQLQTDLIVQDVDDTFLTRAYVTITSGYLSTEDILALPFPNASYPNLVGTWYAFNGTLIIAKNGVDGRFSPSNPSENVLLTEFYAALQAVTYRNTNQADPTVNILRRLTITVLDASSTESNAYKLSNTASWSISVIPTNDVPVWGTLPSQSLDEHLPINTTLVDFSRRGQFPGTGIYISDNDTTDILTYSITGGNTNNSWKLLDIYSCVLQVANVMDYELGVRTWTLSLSVTDNNSANDTFKGILNSTTTVTITLRDIDEPPMLTSLSSYTLNEAETINALDPLTNASQRDTIIVSDWDTFDTNGHNFTIVSLSPTDGDTLLMRGLNASSIFQLIRTINTRTPTLGAQPITSFTLGVKPGIYLSSLLAKTFFLQIVANENLRSLSTALSSNAIQIAVYVRRDNAQVNWTGYPTVLPLTVNENSPIGTMVTVNPLAAYDADTNQQLTYTIVSSTGLPGLFSIVPVGGYPVRDPWTNNTVVPYRTAHLMVARDALDFEMGDRWWLLRIVVSDDGFFNNTRIPPVATTWAELFINISLVNINDNPTITDITGVPQAGLSTRGGQRIILTGTGLGLPDGPAASVNATYSNGNYTFPATGCTVTRRLTEITCLTSDGYGYSHAWIVYVGGDPLTPNVPTSSASIVRVSYAAPQVLAFNPPSLLDLQIFNATYEDYPNELMDISSSPECGNENDSNITTSLCTKGSNRMVLTGTNFPSVVHGMNGALISIHYGPTGTEYQAIGCKVIEDYRRILCFISKGIGDNLRWDVNIGELHSNIPITSYSIPVITHIAALPSDTTGGTLVELYGYNFGAAAENGLQWVQYEPLVQPLSTGAFGGGGYPSLYLAAYNCSIVIDHVQINCYTAPGFHVNFHWRVRIAEQVSPWSYSLTNYAAPSVTSITPALLATIGNEQLDVRGNSFGDNEVASVSFANISIARSSIIYASHKRFLFSSYPGIGVNHSLVVAVGDVQNITVPFRYAPPQLATISWVSGEGGAAKPLELSLQGSNFGECCYCKFNHCPLRCKGEQGCETNSLLYPGVWHLACEPRICPNRVEDVLQVTIDGAPVSSIKWVMENEMIISTPSLEGNVTITVGSQNSNTGIFKLSDLLSNRPSISTFVVQNVPSSVRETPPTSGGVVARITGNNLQFIGTVYVFNDMGVIACPAVYSTIQYINPTGSTTASLTAVQYGTTVTGVGAIDPATGIFLPPDPITRVVANFTIDPYAVIDTINGTEVWVKRPLLCWCTEWYRNPKFIETDGYVEFIFPPGQGEVRLMVNAKTVNLNSTELFAPKVTYLQPTITAITPNRGPTDGTNITLTVVSAPPAYNLSTIWGPYILPSSTRDVDLSAAPVNRIVFKLTDIDPNARICSIIAWNESSISCTSPEGIPGTPFQVYVLDNKVVLSQGYPFTYDPAIIYQETPPAHGPTLGGTIITLRGYSLGRSEVVDNTSSALNIFMSAISGQGFVQEKIIEQTVKLVSHTHDAISFITLRGEGAAIIVVRYILPSGFSLPGARLVASVLNATYPFSKNDLDDVIGSNSPITTVQFEYDKPLIYKVESERNPCIGLTNNFVRDVVPIVNRTYFGDGTDNVLCFAGINSPRAGPFRGDVITLYGSNFGAGVGTIDIVLLIPVIDPLTNLPQPGTTPAQVRCGIAGGSRSIWESDSLMKCQIVSEIPLQDTILSITTAFKTVLSDRDFNWRIRSVCPPEMFQTVEGGLCQDCYTGALCVGSNAPPRAISGYWKTIPSEWSTRFIDSTAVGAAPFVKCPFAPACTPNQTCVEGHTGFMCSFCLQDWAGGINQLCRPCVSSGANYGVVGLAFIAACIFGAILIRRAMARRSKVVIVAKMLINFLQMISALRVYISTEDAPVLAKTLIRYASLANYVSLDFQAIQCATTFDYYIRFGMYMAIPPGAAIVPAIFLVSYAFFRRSTTGKRIDFSRIGRITVTAVGVLLFFTHNSVVIQILRVWNCASSREGGYLFEQPQIACNSPEHKQLRYIIAPIMGLLYGFGIPLAGVYALSQVRKTMASRRTLKYYGFMYDGFDVKNGKWWWESFIMLRKLLFVALGIVITQKNLQIILGTFTIFVVLVLHMQVRPFEDPYLNNLETVALLGNSAMYFGIMINDLVIDGKLPPYISDIATYFLGFIVILVMCRFLFTLGIIFYAQFKERQLNRSKRKLDERRALYGETATKTLDLWSNDNKLMVDLSEGILITRLSKAQKHSDKVAARERQAREQIAAMLRSGPRDPRERAKWLQERAAIFRSMRGGMDPETDSTFSSLSRSRLNRRFGSSKSRSRSNRSRFTANSNDDSSDTDEYDDHDEGDIFHSRSSKNNIMNQRTSSIGRSTRNLLDLQESRKSIRSTRDLLQRISRRGIASGDEEDEDNDNENNLADGSLRDNSILNSTGWGTRKPRKGISFNEEDSPSVSIDTDSVPQKSSNQNSKSNARPTTGIRLRDGRIAWANHRSAENSNVLRDFLSSTSGSRDIIPYRYHPHISSRNRYSVDTADGPVYRFSGTAVYSRNIGITADLQHDPDPFGEAVIYESTNPTHAPYRTVAYGEDYGDSDDDDDDKFDSEGNYRSLDERLALEDKRKKGGEEQSIQSSNAARNSVDSLGITALSNLIFGTSSNNNNRNLVSTSTHTERTRVNPLKSILSSNNGASTSTTMNPLESSFDDENLGFWNSNVKSNNARHMRVNPLHQPSTSGQGTVGNKVPPHLRSQSADPVTRTYAPDADELLDQMQNTNIPVTNKLTVKGAAKLHRHSSKSTIDSASTSDSADDEDEDDHRSPNMVHGQELFPDMGLPTNRTDDPYADAFTSRKNNNLEFDEIERTFSNPLHGTANRMALSPKALGANASKSLDRYSSSSNLVLPNLQNSGKSNAILDRITKPSHTRLASLINPTINTGTQSTTDIPTKLSPSNIPDTMIVVNNSPVPWNSNPMLGSLQSGKNNPLQQRLGQANSAPATPGRSALLDTSTHQSPTNESVSGLSSMLDSTSRWFMGTSNRQLSQGTSNPLSKYSSKGKSDSSTLTLPVSANKGMDTRTSLPVDLSEYRAPSSSSLPPLSRQKSTNQMDSESETTKPSGAPDPASLDAMVGALRSVRSPLLPPLPTNTNAATNGLRGMGIAISNRSTTNNAVIPIDISQLPSFTESTSTTTRNRLAEMKARSASNTSTQQVPLTIPSTENRPHRSSSEVSETDPTGIASINGSNRSLISVSSSAGLTLRNIVPGTVQQDSSRSRSNTNQNTSNRSLGSVDSSVLDNGEDRNLPSSFSGRMSTIDNPSSPSPVPVSLTATMNDLANMIETSKTNHRSKSNSPEENKSDVARMEENPLKNKSRGLNDRSNQAVNAVQTIASTASIINQGLDELSHQLKSFSSSSSSTDSTVNNGPSKNSLAKLHALQQQNKLSKDTSKDVKVLAELDSVSLPTVMRTSTAATLTSPKAEPKVIPIPSNPTVSTNHLKLRSIIASPEPLVSSTSTINDISNELSSLQSSLMSNKMVASNSNNSVIDSTSPTTVSEIPMNALARRLAQVKASNNSSSTVASTSVPMGTVSDSSKQDSVTLPKLDSLEFKTSKVHSNSLSKNSSGNNPLKLMVKGTSVEAKRTILASPEPVVPPSSIAESKSSIPSPVPQQPIKRTILASPEPELPSFSTGSTIDTSTSSSIKNNIAKFNGANPLAKSGSTFSGPKPTSSKVSSSTSSVPSIDFDMLGPLTSTVPSTSSSSSSANDGSHTNRLAASSSSKSGTNPLSKKSTSSAFKSTNSGGGDINFDDF